LGAGSFRKKKVSTFWFVLSFDMYNIVYLQSSQDVLISLICVMSYLNFMNRDVRVLARWERLPRSVSSNMLGDVTMFLPLEW
jgi:hypothetical protein